MKKKALTLLTFLSFYSMAIPDGTAAFIRCDQSVFHAAAVYFDSEMSVIDGYIQDGYTHLEYTNESCIRKSETIFACRDKYGHREFNLETLEIEGFNQSDCYGFSVYHKP